MRMNKTYLDRRPYLDLDRCAGREYVDPRDELVFMVATRALSWGRISRANGGNGGRSTIVCMSLSLTVKPHLKDKQSGFTHSRASSTLTTLILPSLKYNGAWLDGPARGRR